METSHKQHNITTKLDRINIGDSAPDDGKAKHV